MHLKEQSLSWEKNSWNMTIPSSEIKSLYPIKQSETGKQIKIDFRNQNNWKKIKWYFKVLLLFSLWWIFNLFHLPNLFLCDQRELNFYNSYATPSAHLCLRNEIRQQMPKQTNNYNEQIIPPKIKKKNKNKTAKPTTPFRKRFNCDTVIET